MATLYTNVCLYCTQSFVVPAKERYKRFCSKEHRLANSAKPTHACKQCNSPTQNTFCTRSCAATYNNQRRSNESNEKKRETLRVTFAKKYENYTRRTKSKKKNTTRLKRKMIKRPCKVGSAKWNKRLREEAFGPYSKVYYSVCAHSGKIFASSSPGVKYSPEYRELYSQNGRARFQFTFRVGDYPELFDLSLIEKHGWFSVGGRCGLPINKTGVSRDHKVSVNEAIRNNYDPYYIKHPLNCELMLHTENTKKKTASSITYEELKILVHEYDMRYKT